MTAPATGAPQVLPGSLEPSNGQANDDDDLAVIAAAYTPIDWPAAFAGQPDDIEWLFGEFLERGTLAALFAKPGTGKSLLALEVALTLVRAGETVLYLDDENRVTDLVERLEAFGCQPGELDRLRLYSFAGLPPLDTPRGGRHLLALAAAAAADLVVIDTTTRMVAGRENDSDTFLALYRCSLAPLKRRGITVLRLDHPGKDEDRGQRGSSAKDGDVDTTWRLTTLTDGLDYRLERIKSRSGHGPAAFHLRRCHSPLSHEWAPAEQRTARDAARVVEIVAVLERAGLPPETGRPTARAALKAAGVSAPNKLVEDAIRARKAAHGQSAGSAGSGAKAELPACPTPIGGAGGQGSHPARQKR